MELQWNNKWKHLALSLCIRDDNPTQTSPRNHKKLDSKCPDSLMSPMFLSHPNGWASCGKQLLAATVAPQSSLGCDDCGKSLG